MHLHYKAIHMHMLCQVNHYFNSYLFMHLTIIFHYISYHHIHINTYTYNNLVDNGPVRYSKAPPIDTSKVPLIDIRKYCYKIPESTSDRYTKVPQIDTLKYRR